MRQCTYPGCDRKHYGLGYCETHWWRSKNAYPMDAPIKRVLHKIPMRERLLARSELEPNSGCWLWNSSADRYGYGTMGTTKGKTDKAYRVSYREFVGSIPAGARVLHRCNTPSCINPNHLFLGDQRSNMADMVAKERQARGEKKSRAKLNPAKIALMRAVRKLGFSYAQIAALNGVHPSTVSRIFGGKRWKHL